MRDNCVTVGEMISELSATSEVVMKEGMIDFFTIDTWTMSVQLCGPLSSKVLLEAFRNVMGRWIRERGSREEHPITERTRIYIRMGDSVGIKPLTRTALRLLLGRAAES